MIVAKVAAAPENLIDLAKDDVDEIKRLAQDFSQEEIQLLFTIFLKTQEEIRWSQYPWVSVEMASVRAVHIPSFKDIDKVIQWIGNSSKNLSDNEAETALPITPLNSKKENPAESTEEPAAYADPPAVNWEEFVNRVKERNSI